MFKIFKNKVQVYALMLEKDLDENIFCRLLTFVSAEKRAEIKRYVHYQDMQRTLMGDVLVRYLIYKKFSLRNNEMFFETNSYGKPSLTNFNHFHFSISHSEKWVVCAIHNTPVGIDVESIKPTNFDIAKLFFTVEEYDDLMSKTGLRQIEYFYELWTIKESYLKTIGKGLSIPLNSFDVDIKKGGFIACDSKTSLSHYFKQYNIDKDYKLAVCTNLGSFSRDVNFLRMDFLCSEFINNCLNLR